MPVHPCGYREHQIFNIIVIQCFGSSLWIQGTLNGSCHTAECKRFIPVDTGNTSTSMICSGDFSVHPCGYREHSESRTLPRKTFGSSLWIQGTQAFGLLKAITIRFIPVDTGNTVHLLQTGSLSPVHPCGYREHSTGVPPHDDDTGSSLWIQGTLLNIHPQSRQTRFIPVDTGNTSAVLAQQKYSAVHPCGYREHSKISNNTKETHGSSLWIQGTRRRSVMGAHVTRFIPVDTGNTNFIDYP